MKRLLCLFFYICVILVFSSMSLASDENIDLNYVDEAFVKGVGSISVGGEIVHKKHGSGIVVFINKFDDMVVAKIKFKDRERPMVISDENFEKLQ